MDFSGIKNRIINFQKEGKSLFTTSSYQSHSLVLLHMISRIDNNIPVVFKNTGYHFPETLSFRDQIVERFNIKAVDLKPSVSKIMQKDAEGKLLFTSDPDQCCRLNKTMPLQEFMADYDVWINGIRADQSKERKEMKVEQTAKGRVIRFHPMLDWVPKMINDYLKEFDIPQHPLESKGYSSIGCEPCTRKMDLEMLERDTRWFGLNKTECGLHIDLAAS